MPGVGTGFRKKRSMSEGNVALDILTSRLIPRVAFQVLK